VSDTTPTRLPIVNDRPDDEPSCSPKAYVSNEEKAILDGMRQLRERAVELKRQLAAASSDAERRPIEEALGELRAQRADLAQRREQASRRKMIMLGHLPPDDEVSLF
jgi:hypothetical protein